MGSNLMDGTMDETTRSPGFDRGAAVTRSLLGYGMIVGPLYLIVGVVQGAAARGIRLRAPLAQRARQRSRGVGADRQLRRVRRDGVAAAVGIARVVGRSGRATYSFLAAYGVSMLGASIFRADPVDGFPVGTPLGYPTSISTPGILHFVFGMIGFVSLGISCLLAARLMSRRRQPALARVSLVAGLIVLIGFFGGAALGGAGILGIWISVVVGWAWLAVLSRHLYRVSPDPNCRAD